MGQTAAQAAKLLAKFGEAATIVFAGTAGFDPITGEPVTPTSGTSYTAKGYAGKYVSSDIDGTLIQANDIRLVLELIPQRPERGCSAIVDGTTYRVMNVQAIRKAGADVIYVCQLRAN